MSRHGAARRACLILSLLLILVGFTLWIIGVWTVGDNSGRYGATGGFAFIAAFLLIMTATFPE